MDKFSFYDFLSYLLPGMVACFLGYQFFQESFYTFKSMGELSDSLLVTALGLAMGLAIHRISFCFYIENGLNGLFIRQLGK